MKLRAHKYLDVGCGYGDITAEVAKTVGAREVYGIDLDKDALESMKNRGFKVFNLDVSKDKIPLSDGSIELVTAFELIEHLLNPDHMLKEVFRILKSGGQFLLSTPNLASWANRIALLLGYQPYNAEISTEIVAGVPWRAYSFAKPSGHIRPYTLRALKELLSYYGFTVVKVKGAPGVNPRCLAFIDKLFSKRAQLARRLVVLARK
ncbi:class I SAM-dependent methyltransferase [Candidatus Bathyarchaeota archaeon]|nr:class I SAM-dependent methyltransferase [Candidatus Bathyarchaeota archaeon]